MQFFTKSLSLLRSNLLLGILFFIIPFGIASYQVFSGSLAFWYDPARDLLLALGNIHKFTLIGEPSGIPNLFYGPYWIWLLSIPLLVTKDPRFVAWIVLTIPFFLLFPFFLSQLKDVFEKKVWVMLWVIFFMTFSGYGIQLWNPHPAPLLILITLVLITRQQQIKLPFDLSFVCVGILLGLVMNFSLSFGSAFLFGIVLFYSIDSLSSLSASKTASLFSALFILLRQLFFLSCGVGIVFIPFLIFEIRHGFHQIEAIRFTLSQSTLYNSAVVGQVGLSADAILKSFLNLFPILLHLSPLVSFFVFISTIIFAIRLQKRNRLVSNPLQRRLLLLLFSIITMILTIYLSTKNPVWQYHFIGVDVIILLFIGICVQLIKPLKHALMAWTGILFVVYLSSFFHSFYENPLRMSSLASKEHIVRYIYTDNASQPFSVAIYDPAIYTYDYDYLFNWFQEQYHLLPTTSTRTQKTYVIIPKGLEKRDHKSFIEQNTPPHRYHTVWEKTFDDGTTVVKRQRE